MKESGSGLPQFQTVKAPRLPVGGVQSSAIPAAVFLKVLPFFVAIVLVMLVFIGYLVYTLFFGGVEQKQSSQVATSTVNGEQEVKPAPFEPVALIHQTAFKKPVDQKIPFVLSGVASSATDLQTYGQKFQAALGRASLTAKFVEVEARGDGGESLGVADVFSAAGTFVIDGQFLAEHFSPDVTIFAYREGKAFWPGYVLTLKSDENWLFLKSEVEKLEVSSKILNFFLNPPESHGEFYGGEIGGQSVRIADFSPGARFVYGWVRGYLVFSTSYAGFVEAVGRL